jgi:hypothetical protein
MPNDEPTTMKHIHFFHHQELPVPGTTAKPVSYPVCEWRAPKGDAMDADQHPLNRFVCSWLTSDMAEVARCDEALQALAQLESHSIPEWFAAWISKPRVCSSTKAMWGQRTPIGGTCQKADLLWLR